MLRILLILLIIFIFANLFSAEREPDWTPVVYTNSTVAYCQIFIDDENAESGDILGAFCEGECRGIGTVFEYQSSAYCVLNIQGETIETINFQVWDASEDFVCSVEETIQSYPGHDLGYPPDFLQIEAESPAAENFPPIIDLPDMVSFFDTEVYTFPIRNYISDADNDNYSLEWSGNENIDIEIINPEWEIVEYGTFFQLQGLITLEGEPAPLSSQFYVFSGEECRGISVLESYNGNSIVNMTVECPLIEEMSFKLLSEGIIYHTDFNLECNPGGNAGYPQPLSIDFNEESFEGVLQLSVSDWCGQETLSFSVYDYNNEAVADETIVNVISSNHPPEINLPGEFTFNEDESLTVDFTPYVSDPDEDELSLYLAEAGENVFADIDGMIVTISAENNWYGSEGIVFGVSDDEGRLTATDEVIVIVTSVNDPPVIELPAELSWNEDEILLLNLTDNVYDIEDDFLDINWESDEDITIELAELSWQTVEYAETMTIYGRALINGQELEADDKIGGFVNGECRGYGYRFPNSNYTTFNVYTQEVELMDFKILDISEDIVYNTNLEIETQPGGSAGYPPNFLELFGNDEYESFSYEFFAPQNWNGSAEAALQVTDEDGLSSFMQLDLTVNAVNDLPVLELPDWLEIEAGNSLQLDLTTFIWDVDSDSLNIWVESTELNAIVVEWQLTIYTLEENNGLYLITVYASDGYGNTSQEIQVNVIQANLAPVMIFPPEITFLEDSETSFYWENFVTDPEGEDLSLSWSGNSNILIAEENGLLLFSATANWNGSEEIFFSASDGEKVSQDTVLVNVTQVNDVPQFVTSTLELNEDEIINLNLMDYWFDADGDSLIFTVLSAQNLEVEISGTQMTVLPEENWNGITELLIEADDGMCTAEGEFNVNVAAVNDPPWIDLPAQISFNEDEIYIFYWQDYIGDVDADELIINTESANIEFIFSDIAELFCPPNWFGQEVVYFSVSDGVNRLEASDSMLVTVFPVNDAPLLSLPDSLLLESTGSQTFDMSLFCSDIENDSLTLEVLSSEHIAAEVEGMLLELTAETAWQGIEFLECSLSDGEDTTEGELVVSVYYPDYEFTLELPETITFNEDESYLLNLNDYLINENGADVNVVLGGLESISFSLDELEILLSGNENWNGSETLQITLLNEESGAQITEYVSVDVLPVNDAPVLELPTEVSFAEDTSLFINFSSSCRDIDSSPIFLNCEGEYPYLNIQVQNFNVLFSASLNYNGFENVVFSLSDGEEIVYDTLLVTVTPVNDPPNINLPNRFYLYEDDVTTINMEQYILEFDDDELQISISGNTNLQYDIDSLNVTFTASENWYGSEELTITVDDGSSRLSDSDNVLVVVLPVNDPPIVNLPQHLSFPEDENYYLDLSDYVYDIEGDELSLQVSANFLNCSLSDMILTLWGDENWNGEDIIILNVSDEENLVTSNIEITVTPVNDPPQLLMPEYFELNEDEVLAIDLDEYSFDLDGDKLSFTVNSPALNYILDGSSLDIWGDENWNGLTALLLTCSDDEYSISDSASVLVFPLNDPPVLNLPDTISWLEDESYGFDLDEYSSDVDGDELFYTAFSDTIIVDLNGSQAEFFAPENWFGTEQLMITASDNEERLTASAFISVEVLAVNDSPILNLPDEILFYEDTILNVDFAQYCSDIDSENLYLELLAGSDSIFVQIEDLSVTFSAEANWNGSEEMTFELSDGDLADTGSVLIEVIATSDEPQLTLPANFTLQEDSDLILDFSPYIQNIENYDLNLVVENNVNIDVDIYDYTVNLVPEENWNGQEMLEFHLLNTEFAIDVYDSVLVIVNAVNDIPQIELPELLTGLEDEETSIDLADYCSDIDSPDLLYSASSSDAEVELENSLLTVWLSENANGYSHVLITVSDGFLSASDTLIVYFEPVNDAPVLQFPQEFSFAEDDSLLINLENYCEDIDGDSISYSAYSEELIITLDGEELLLMAEPNWNGTAVLQVTASDGVARVSAADTLLVTVWAVNDPPQLNLPANFVFNEDESFVIDLAEFVFDIDDDDLEINAESNILLMAEDGMLLTVSAPQDWFGSDDLEICVTDGQEEICAISQIVVQPVNDPPVLQLPEDLTFPEDGILQVDFSEYAFDVDDTDLLLTAESPVLFTEISGMDMIISAPENWFGSALLYITVSDSSGAQASGELNVIVENENDPPQIILPDSFIFAEDTSATYNLADWVYDADEDTLSYIINGETIISELDGSLVTLSAPENWNGSEVIAVSVDDGQQRVLSTDLVEVIVTPVNDAPWIELPDMITGNEDEAIMLDLSQYSGDIDNDFLNYSGSSSQFTINISGAVAEIYAPENWFGSGNVVFNVSDGQERLMASDTVLVVLEPVNDAPALDLPQEFVFPEDDNLIVNLLDYVSDVDDESFIFTVYAEDIIYEINDSFLQLSAAENWNGNEMIQITADDENSRLQVADSALVVVTPVNDAPWINLPAEISFLEDNAFELDMSLYSGDIDGDILQYNAASNILLIEWQDEIALISAPPDWFGSEQIVIQVDDNASRLAVIDTVMIEVAPVNDPPQLNLPDEIEITSGEIYSLNVELYAQDIDSDSLIVSAWSDSLIINIAGLLVQIESLSGWYGNAELEITVSDGEFTAVDSLDVIVLSEEISQTYELVSNWNWISFNSLPAENSVSEILSQLQDNAVQIKSQTSSSTWWEDWGWLGALTHLEAGKMYLLKLNEACSNFTVTGPAADTQMPISLIEDWNWIGYLPQEEFSAQEILNSLEPNAVQLKDQQNSLTWWENWGWLGALETMSPQVGYKLKMTSADTLLYPQSVRPDSKTHKNNSKRLNWRVESGFEMNMTLLAEMEIETGTPVVIEEAAFMDDNGICHGCGLFLPEIEAWYFTIGADVTQQLLSLHILLQNGQELIARQPLMFSNNDILGTPSQPIVFHFNYTDAQENINEINYLGRSYPNPAVLNSERHTIVIPYQISAASEIIIDVYNCKGQKVARLYDEMQTAGKHNIVWNACDENSKPVASGIYFYKLSTSDFEQCRKLMIIR